MNSITKQDYNQSISFLHKSIREEKERLEEVFLKRSTFKRQYFEILEDLSQNKHASCAHGYLELARKQLLRRDYDTTSVLVLLGTLCMLNAESDLNQVIDFFEERFLQSTFCIKLLKLLLQAKSDGLKSEYLTLWSMMKIIPVFEEERILMQNVVSL
ncbi:MAG: hypothetical protein EU530_00455 [Promethearchaeota archaeon]|nr:MAG: hypothetical protein EU530_00455 [Candidatus Lokiarchaeota archaeon]